jgi:predicted small integral membrane protein
MIRQIKILLAFTVALWGVSGGLGNLSSYGEGMQSVASVLSKETLPETALPNGPVTPSPVLVTLGFALIWVLKLVGGGLCLFGAIQMWAARTATAGAFAHASRWAVSGCGVLLFMLFFGFSFVAVGPYKLYLSPLISAVELAALFAAQIGVVMIFLNQQELDGGAHRLPR